MNGNWDGSIKSSKGGQEQGARGQVLNLGIKQLQQILFLQRLLAYLLILRYVQALKDAYTYNNGNQLTEDRHNQYEYDKNGNLIKKTEWHDGKPKIHTYTYDYENRLIKVEIQKDNRLKTVTFTYDPFGRRISKTVQREEIDNDDNDDRDYIRTTHYVYDNEDIIMEYNNKGKVTARYTHGLGIDEPLAIEQKGHTYYYHTDGLGSIVALTDNKQKVAQSYSYDSFGNMKQHGHKVKQPYTFTGREWDKEIKLYYNRERYRDPYSGIFITKDPILHPANGPPPKACDRVAYIPRFYDVLFTPLKLNPYLYTEGNPVNFTDPYGLMGAKPPTPSLGDFIPPSKLPCGKTADDYCGQEYTKKAKECALKPDVYRGCLQKADRWFKQCQTWAIGIIQRDIPCPPQDCKDK